MSKQATATAAPVKTDSTKKHKEAIQILLSSEMSIDKAAILQYLQS